MNLLNAFRPEYLHNPKQILRRLRRPAHVPDHLVEYVELPWGMPLKVRPSETIGANIVYFGLIDLPVAEALVRLCDPGEHACDIGANIGQMTSLLRICVGPFGHVDSFEPHPEIFQELTANELLWRKCGKLGTGTLHNIALSNKDGNAVLVASSAWNNNRGISRLSNNPVEFTKNWNVNTAQIDTHFSDVNWKVCKLDVEGHELDVLKGAESVLQKGNLRDLIFEDLNPFPSPVHQFLISCGYSLFHLGRGLRGPKIKPLHSRASQNLNPKEQDYLATLDPERALRKYEPRGYKSLRKLVTCNR
ncbi:MAG: FkbM family methyltransferase [Verrucomicrobiota bacterium]|nr:FkbM family methyltransferase [Verrucomicrobiota bacterium]